MRFDAVTLGPCVDDVGVVVGHEGVQVDQCPAGGDGKGIGDGKTVGVVNPAGFAITGVVSKANSSLRGGPRRSSPHRQPPSRVDLQRVPVIPPSGAVTVLTEVDDPLDLVETDRGAR